MLPKVPISSQWALLAGVCYLSHCPIKLLECGVWQGQVHAEHHLQGVTCLET